MSAISFNRVVKSYGNKLVLDGFSLNIKEGEIFALAGVNGAGKTTAIKSLLKLVNISSGQISLFLSKLNRAEIGFAPEVPDMPDFFTVKELLLHALNFYSEKGDENEKFLLKRVVDLFELDSLLDLKVSELSKGNRQRVSLAASVIHKPKLVIFDEPSGGLDPFGRDLVKKAIKELNREGATILFTTHILSDIVGLCHRIGIVSNGKIVFCGTPSEFCDEKPLSEIEKVFVEFKVPDDLIEEPGQLINYEKLESNSKLDYVSISKQVLLTAKTVLLKSFRSNLLFGTILLMLPFIWGSWIFEQNNPGFQTGFIADLGTIFVSVFAFLLTLILSLEHIFWVKEGHSSYFYLSRMSPGLLPLSKFLGVVCTVGLALIFMVLLLIGFMFFNTGTIILYPFYIGFSVFMQVALVVSVFSLFSAFLPKLTAISLMIILYLVGLETDTARLFVESLELGFLVVPTEALFALLPDFSLFRFESESISALFLIVLYALFQSLFYLVAGGKILSKKDL